ncbi:MAG TPA: hypothetical protein VF217_12530 [Rhodanobacteraceae bacterium]
MATIVELRSGRWRARARRRGAPSNSETFARKIDAEAWARKLESDIERGKWRDNTAAERTFLRDALKRYEEERTPGKRGSVQ